MMQAYRDGIPENGKPVPDGAAFAKIEWLQDRDEKPYGVTVSGTQTEMSFMVKDSKRFPDTDGWGYATFAYDASSDAFKPATSDPSFARACHGCHTAHAKALDFAYSLREAVNGMAILGKGMSERDDMPAEPDQGRRHFLGRSDDARRGGGLASPEACPGAGASEASEGEPHHIAAFRRATRNS